MIGQTVESRPSPPIAALVFLILALGLAAITLADNDRSRFGWAAGALMPAGVALALFLSRPRPVRVQFTREGMEVEAPAELIPYGAVQGLVAAGRPGNPEVESHNRYPLYVIHDRGTLALPPQANVPSEEVFQFLLGIFPASGAPQANKLLHEYQERHAETFGADRIFSYRARIELGHGSRGILALFLAIAGASALWIVFGAAQGSEGFLVAGVVILFVSLIALGIIALANRPIGGVQGLKNWRNAGLVISPVGIALVQGDMKGEMRWDELRGLKFKPGGNGYLIDPLAYRAIVLHFEGAELNVADVYDRPLNLIYQAIRRYWRPG